MRWLHWPNAKSKRLTEALDEHDPVRAVLKVNAERERGEQRRFWVVAVAGVLLGATALLQSVRLGDVASIQRAQIAQDAVAECQVKATNKITDGQVAWQAAITEIQALPIAERANIDRNAEFLAKTNAAINQQRQGINEREACRR